jgi:hypothetical protein
MATQNPGLDPANLNYYGADPADVADYQKSLQESVDALQARYANPNWFNVAAGFLKPQLGGFAASLGSAGQAMGENLEKQRESMLPVAQMKAQLALSKIRMGQSKQAAGIAEGQTNEFGLIDVGAAGNVGGLTKGSRAALTAQSDAAQKNLALANAAIAAAGPNRPPPAWAAQVVAKGGYWSKSSVAAPKEPEAETKTPMPPPGAPPVGGGAPVAAGEPAASVKMQPAGMVAGLNPQAFPVADRLREIQAMPPGPQQQQALAELEKIYGPKTTPPVTTPAAPKAADTQIPVYFPYPPANMSPQQIETRMGESKVANEAAFKEYEAVNKLGSADHYNQIKSLTKTTLDTLNHPDIPQVMGILLKKGILNQIETAISQGIYGNIGDMSASARLDIPSIIRAGLPPAYQKLGQSLGHQFQLLANERVRQGGKALFGGQLSNLEVGQAKAGAPDLAMSAGLAKYAVASVANDALKYHEAAKAATTGMRHVHPDESARYHAVIKGHEPYRQAYERAGDREVGLWKTFVAPEHKATPRAAR